MDWTKNLIIKILLKFVKKKNLTVYPVTSSGLKETSSSVSLLLGFVNSLVVAVMQSVP